MHVRPRSRSLAASALIALGAASALAAPPPASAADATVAADLRTTGAAAKRLAGSGVRVTATGGATATSASWALPVAGVDAARLHTTVRHRGSLVFRAAGRRVAATDLRTIIGSTATVQGRIAGKRLTLLSIGLSASRRAALAGANTVTLAGARATVSTALLRRLRTTLRRPRLRGGALGTITLRVIGRGSTVVEGSASAPPPTVGARKVVGGTASWGVQAGLRQNFAAGQLNYNTQEPMRSLFDGATQLADDTFGFAVVGGWYDPATGQGQVALRGGVRFGYVVGGWKNYPPKDGIAHGIWASFAGLTVTLGGSGGSLSGLTDAGFHERAWIRPERRAFADVLPGAAAVLDGAVGTATWSGVPLRLNEAGGPLGLGFFPAGSDLDPLVLVARLGS